MEESASDKKGGKRGISSRFLGRIKWRGEGGVRSMGGPVCRQERV